jgi:dTDP-4-amino-4,6-dideoxygalactose transaminase
MEFRDLKRQYDKYRNELNESIQKVLDSANFISGQEVEFLEQKLAEYVGVKNCISCANGTDAMVLVLKAWNIGPGDAVFVPNFTFFATAEVVSLVGATPIFVDVEYDSFNIDYNSLQENIIAVLAEKKLRPKAIIPVDLFGLPANYEKLIPIAHKYNLFILEDAAQGFGGSFHQKKNCSFGHASTTSFFPAKPLGCYGDGGAIFTDDDFLASVLRSLRVHGKGSNKYDNLLIGTNSRLDTIQAAILLVKLKALVDHELSDVNEISKLYNQGLVNLPVVTPKVEDGYFSSFAQYTIKCKDEKTRNDLKHFLIDKGIPVNIYYEKTMNQQIAFASHFQKDYEFPVSKMLSKVSLSLPMHPYLFDSEVEHIISSIKEFYNGK